MKSLRNKSFLYRILGHVSAIAFSCFSFYLLVQLFMTDQLLGGGLLIASVLTSYLLVGHTNFIGEYEESLDY